MPRMINLASTGPSRYAGLANKPRQKYVLFAKLSLELIGACEVAKNPPNLFNYRNPTYPVNLSTL